MNRQKTKSPSARNKQYWINKGYTESDAMTMARSRMPGTYEYFKIFKKLPEDESIIQSKQWQDARKSTLENFIKRYGEDIGRARWEHYRYLQAKTNTYEYKKEKYGWTEEQFIQYNESRACTLENFIRRHGIEEGNLRWNSYVERQKYAGCSIEYFIEKYGEVEGIEKYQNINILKSNNLNTFLIRYDGDEEKATTEYLKYKESQHGRRILPYSSIACELFDELYSRLLTLGFHKIFYTNNIGEWYIYDNIQKRMYYIDFFLKEKGLVIEFNGDYWHANPEKYKGTDIINYPNNKKEIAENIWENDAKKLNCVRRHPDIKDILVIWESEFRENKEKTIEKCMQYLMK